MNYNEFANLTIESLIRVVEDCPEHRVYAINPKVVLVICYILKFLIRPRNEEQFEIIKKLEKRIVFECKHIEEEFTTSYEGEDLSQEVE